MYWTDSLPYKPCGDALKWLRTQPDAETAWRTCQRGDWMLYHAGQLAGPPGDDRRRPLVLAACDCAELSAHLAGDEEQLAIALALTVSREWATGGDADLDDVQATYSAATYATASAATYAAYAAIHAAIHAAAVHAADSATYAATYAATAYASERDRVLAECADIVREYYREVPRW